MQQTLRASILPLALLVLGPGVDGAARAQETPAWSLSGFGTLGLVHSNERQADYGASALKPSGAGASHAWSADVDSRLGVQLDLALNRQWSAVLQVISEQGADGSYRPRIEWANVKYQATPDLALRAGRIALPMFLTADYRKIGYAYPWVRPPVEIYAALPSTRSDGVDATWRWSLGRVRNAAQFYYGHDTLDLPTPFHGWARGILGVSNTGDWGAFSLRTSLMTAQLSADIGAPLFRDLAAGGAGGQALARRYALDHKRSTVAHIGLSYDPGPWFLMAEAGGGHTESLLGSTRSAYLGAGWRYGPFTPYLGYARARAASATRVPASAAAAPLAAELNTLLAGIPQQSTVSAGLRWDLCTNAAIKLQGERVTPRDGSRGTLINAAPGFQSGHAATVLSAALDFVY